VVRSGGGGGTRLAERVTAAFPQLYLALLGLGLAIGHAMRPILAVDTDLWYHLNAGRYIAAAHAVPHAPFFSFVQPPPVWLDYYWLSQVLWFGVFSATGYAGMVALRAAAAVGVSLFVFLLLRHGRGRSEGWGYTALVFTLLSLFLIGRLTMVRPCILSYLLIAVFAYLLETRRALWSLPFLALAWVNLHGIEYPVMLLLLGAYLGEWMLARLGWLTRAAPPPAWAFAAVAVAMAMVFVTPNGLALLSGPFQPLGFSAQYIDELKPVDPWTLLSLRLDKLYVGRPSFQTAVLALGGLAALTSLVRGSWRPAHLVLFAGGVFLLPRADRFGAEFMLLALPLVAAYRPQVTWLPALPAGVGVALGVLLSVFPFAHLYYVMKTDCPFPLCTRGLPEGSVAFLRHVNAQGAVLNHPNDGGYLEWELYPRDTIFVDLQTPFLFSDVDVFRADQAFADPVVFGSLVSEYHPPFVLAPRRAVTLGAFVSKVSDYVPVFIDDDSVLYASASARPQIVSAWGITAIDPFSAELIDKSSPEGAARAATELARANQVYPAGSRLRVLEGNLAIDRGDFQQALHIADDLIPHHPDLPAPYQLRGDALLHLGQYPEAAEAYEASLKRGGDTTGPGQLFYLESRLWACYMRSGKKAEAYRAMKLALGDIFDPEVGYQELASFASAALDSGHTAEGTKLLEFALLKTPASEPDLRKTMENRLRSLAAAR
jgi:hypothetical protein